MPSTTARKPRILLRIGVLAGLAFLSFTPKSRAADPALLESLGQDELQSAFRALREMALTRDALTDLAINRAALAGILEILGPGAELLPASDEPTSEPHPNLVTTLPNGITYARVSVIDDAFIQKLTALPKAEAGLILDLRCPGGALDAPRASQLASVFSPPNSPHFSIVGASGEEIEVFTQAPGGLRRRDQLVLLIDSRTSPTAETAAAVIRFHNRDRCLLIGEPTRGRAALYDTMDLGENTRLRFAKAGVRLPDTTLLFGAGLNPDLLAPSEVNTVDETLSIPDGESLTKYLTEKERPILNEAALVAGTNPELPALLAKAKSDSAPPEAPPLQDAALRQAVDFLTARAFLKKSAPK